MKLRLPLIVCSFCVGISGCGGNDTQTAKLASNVSVGIIPCTYATPPTSSPFNISVEGNGTLRMSRDGNIKFISSGTFQLEMSTAILACSKYPAYSGYIVNTFGERVTGYAIESSGTFSTSLSELNIYSKGTIVPSSTRQILASIGLAAHAAPLPLNAFSSSNAATYHFTTSVDVYDTLGDKHTVKLFFVKTGSVTWEVFAGAEGTVIDVGQLTFNSTGSLVASTLGGQLHITVPLTNGAVPLNINFDLTGTTASSSGFIVNAMSQDGYALGSVDGFTIDQDGTITSRYDNGQTRDVGKMLLTQ